MLGITYPQEEFDFSFFLFCYLFFALAKLVDKGRLYLRKEHFYELSLTLRGPLNSDLWRLLSLDVLVTDPLSTQAASAREFLANRVLLYGRLQELLSMPGWRPQPNPFVVLLKPNRVSGPLYSSQPHHPPQLRDAPRSSPWTMCDISMICLTIGYAPPASSNRC